MDIILKSVVVQVLNCSPLGSGLWSSRRDDAFYDPQINSATLTRNKVLPRHHSWRSSLIVDSDRLRTSPFGFSFFAAILTHGWVTFEGWGNSNQIRALWLMLMFYSHNKWQERKGEEFPSFPMFSADKVFIIGTNDLSSSPHETIFQNLSRMYDLVKAHGAKLVCVTLPGSSYVFLSFLLPLFFGPSSLDFFFFFSFCDWMPRLR